jgi:predicted nucleic acid-binding protein
MSKKGLLELHDIDGRQIAIPRGKITGFVEIEEKCAYGNTFVETGPAIDGLCENGWYVTETYEEVRELYTKEETEND